MATRSRERAAFLECVLSTALEGGINYWSRLDDVTKVDAPDDIVGWGYASATLREWPPSDGCSLDCVEGKCTGHTVTIESIASALSVITTGKGSEVAERIKLHLSYVRMIREADNENDAGDIDADLADAIVQVSIFGEVVYG